MGATGGTAIAAAMRATMLAAALALAAGCATVAVPAPAPRPVVVWPKPPEVPRIAYVNAVARPDDWGIAEGFAAGFWKFLVGTVEIPLVNPHGVAVDAEERLYVVDNFSRKVHVYDRRGNRHFVFPEQGPDFVSPIGIAIDERRGRVYVTDSADAVVRVFDREGVEVSGGIRGGAMGRPTGIAVSAATDELLVVDTLNSTVLRFSLGDHALKGLTGAEGTADGRFHSPTHLSVSRDGGLVVTDSLNHRVQVFAPDGKFLRAFGAAGDTPGHFSRPKGAAVDSDGNIYVVDALFDNVQVFDRNGVLLIAFGGPGQGPGEFWLPSGIFIDRGDAIYVSDSYNKRVQVFQYLKNGEPPS